MGPSGPRQRDDGTACAGVGIGLETGDRKQATGNGQRARSSDQNCLVRSLQVAPCSDRHELERVSDIARRLLPVAC